jgi:hypothetical protein
MLAVMLSLLLLIGGGLIFKWKYEDARDQQAWEDFRQLDKANAERAALALPLVERYEALSVQYPGGTPEMETVAGEILALFPEFRPPGGKSDRLVSIKKIKAILNHYLSIG